MKTFIYKKQIAPRLASKRLREHYTGGLPPECKYALYVIARQDKKSVSYVLEECIIDYFGLPKPKYVKRVVRK